MSNASYTTLKASTYEMFKSPEAAMDNAIESGRARPAIAETPDGKFVVCSRHTANKYGWTYLGRVYGEGVYAEKAAKPAPVAPAAKRAERAAGLDLMSLLA